MDNYDRGQMLGALLCSVVRYPDPPRPPAESVFLETANRIDARIEWACHRMPDPNLFLWKVTAKLRLNGRVFGMNHVLTEGTLIDCADAVATMMCEKMWAFHADALAALTKETDTDARI